MGTLVGNISGTLQTLDYKYHIRGGLRGINLDANNNLTNKLFSMKLGYEETGYYDGNIGKQEWKSSLDGLTRSYTYSYDGASRILSGLYGGGKPNENYSLENMSYDGNGNITSLWRKGLTQNNTFGYVDKLNYGYGVNSNKLTSVSDAINGNLNTGDFRDGNTSGNDYTYYPDGSLKSDLNKGITLIEYNYLKLHRKITFSDGRIINFQYDASGKKLKEIASNGTTTDYLGNLIYENGVLYHISHDEGRIVNGIYEYNFTDHLGNLRVAFKDSLGIAKITQAQDYDSFGLENWTSRFSNVGKGNNFKYNSKETQIETGFIDLGNRMVNPTIGRMLSVDRFAEKYFSLSSFQFANNNPLRYVDVNGDSLMMFKNGVYVTTVDNGSKKMTGFNQESSVDKEGNETFTGGQYFVFNDIELDRENIKNGYVTLDFISSSSVDDMVKNSNVQEQSVFSRWGYAATESSKANNRGKGKMDFRESKSISSGKLSIINGVGYNYADAGNYLWGYAMRKMGFSYLMIKMASNAYAWSEGKSSNMDDNSTHPNPIIRWYENRTWSGDSDADQRAIQRGVNDAGSYWQNKLNSFKKVF